MSDLIKNELLRRVERYEEYMERNGVDKDTGRRIGHECSACGKKFTGHDSYLQTRRHIEVCEAHPLAESLEVERSLRAQLDGVIAAVEAEPVYRAEAAIKAAKENIIARIKGGRE